MNDATDNTGWHEFVTADDSATTHIAYAYEDGSIYLPEGPDVVTATDFWMAAATERFWKLERAGDSALPVRNAQLEAVLDCAESWELQATCEGTINAVWAEAIKHCATDLRRAIEEATT